MGASAATSLISMTSPQGVWITINQFQQLFVLLLTGAFFPQDILNYLSGMDFASFSFNFIPIKKGSFLKNIVDWLSFELDNEYLSVIGLNSGSAVINNLSLITLMLGLIVIHLVYTIVLCIVLKKLLLKYKKLTKLRDYFNKFFALKIYIRTLLESFQFLLI